MNLPTASISLILGLTFAAGAAEITASALRARLAGAGPHPVLIDIRPTAAYRQGSIPGAINVPGQILLEKNLRPANGCVLISDGLADKIDVADLAAKLAQSGVHPVDHLRGGIAAWSELEDAPSTAAVGVALGRTTRYVTYQDLSEREGDVCLIDLRPPEERVVPAGRSCAVFGFCGERKFHYCSDLKDFHRVRRDARPGEGPLVVLVGGVDTDTERVLEKLSIEGVRRTAILLGGEEVIATDGRRGLKRGSGREITVGEGNVSAPDEQTEP